MTADTITSTYFPHNDQKNMYDEPTFSSLHDFHTLLKDNATNVPTELTSVKYGLILLIVSPTDWEILHGHEWISPNDPGTPPILSSGTSTVNMKNITHN